MRPSSQNPGNQLLSLRRFDELAEKDQVKPEELDANKNVIVDTVPPKMGQ